MNPDMEESYPMGMEDKLHFTYFRKEKDRNHGFNIEAFDRSSSAIDPKFPTETEAKESTEEHPYTRKVFSENGYGLWTYVSA
jgi:hypothetical protein